MTPFQVKEGFCKRCQDKRQATLHLKIMSSNAEHFVWVCEKCKTLAPFGGDLWIKRERIIGYLTTEQIAELPVIMPDQSTRCSRCGTRGAELHHWGPRGIFGDDCESWPKDYLCRGCHDIWHAFVTPELVKEF